MRTIARHTGATNAGIGTSYSVLTPTFYFGQGFGQLPDTIGWARPIAVTGLIGYGSGRLHPASARLRGIAAIQHAVSEIRGERPSAADFINHLIPIVEVQLSTPVANNFGNSFVTTGTINPGVIWVGSYFQVGLEAVIPVNGASGSGVGFLGQLHLYLDDMFPKTFGQPLIGSSSTAPRQLTF
jgi:hypothetical protein